MRRNPTIKDVAKRAGVSIATVSRVVNGLGGVSAEAAEAVRRAVAAEGFRPNHISRSLKTAKSRTVGVLVPSLKNPIFADAVQGMQQAAEEGGYSVTLMSSNYEPAKEVSAVDVLLANRVAGLVLTVADQAASAALDLLNREQVPFVLVFNPAQIAGYSAVTIDNAAAAEAVTERLIGLGHRRIAMVAGRFQSSDRSGLRRAGYERAMRAHGLEPGPVLEVEFDTVDLAHQLSRLLGSRPAPTALFCSTDLLAMAAIRSLSGLGLDVPKDVSVAGFDGIAAGAWIRPSLATVVQPAEEIGRKAVRHLLDRIDRAVPPLHLELPYRIRPGESWGRRASRIEETISLLGEDLR